MEMCVCVCVCDRACFSWENPLLAKMNIIGVWGLIKKINLLIFAWRWCRMKVLIIP